VIWSYWVFSSFCVEAYDKTKESKEKGSKEYKGSEKRSQKLTKDQEKNLLTKLYKISCDRILL
jgi:hypothetical protein